MNILVAEYHLFATLQIIPLNREHHQTIDWCFLQIGAKRIVRTEGIQVRRFARRDDSRARSTKLARRLSQSREAVSSIPAILAERFAPASGIYYEIPGPPGASGVGPPHCSVLESGPSFSIQV